MITTNKKITSTVTSGPLDMKMLKDKMNDSFDPRVPKIFISLHR